MKREIIFKAKRLDNGEWVEGYYVSSENKHYIVKSMTDLGMTFSFVDAQEIDPNSLCEYLNIADWDNKKVFTGDYAKSNTSEDMIFVVSYNEETFSYVLELFGTFLEEKVFLHFYSLDMIKCMNLKIIGNIHD